MEYTIFYIYDKTTNDYDYFITRNHLTKALYGLKTTKRETKIKTIINNKNYETRLVKSYIDVSKQKLTEELKWFKTYHKENIKQIINYYNGINNYSLHTLTKNKNLGYGKIREDYVYKFLVENNLFCNAFYRANYLYSEFDFHSNNYYLFELKSLSYSINKYPNAVMNVSKLIYDNFIFIFEYTERDGNKELYFYKYEPNRFYNKRHITPMNRLNTTEIIDIPINELTKFYDGYKILEFVNPCIEINNKLQIKDFEYIIWRDDIRVLLN